MSTEEGREDFKRLLSELIVYSKDKQLDTFSFEHSGLSGNLIDVSSL